MRTLRRQIIQWQTIAWVLLLVVGLVIFLGIVQRTNSVNREKAAQVQITQLQTLLTDVSDTETGMRGYILTSDPLFLTPYNAARDRLQSDIDTQLSLLARDPTTDSPVQQLQIQQVRSTMQRWFTEVAEPEIAARQQNPAVAANVQRQELGKTLIDTVRANIDRYRTTETAILDRRSADADYALVTSRWISLAGIVLAVIVSAITSLVLARNLAREVNRLVVGAGRLASGTLEGSVEEGGSLEFVQLARAFNRMATQLGASRDDLHNRNTALLEQTQTLEQTGEIERSLSDMLRLFTTSYDRAAIFRDLLSLLAVRYGFSVGAIYLYDEWSGTFEVAATRGVASDLRSHIGIDEGLVGQAVRDRKILTVPDAPVITVDTGLSRGPAGIATIAPVYYQDRIMAALILGRQSAPEPLTLAFLDRLVQQLGIALQNLDQYTNLQSLSAQLQARQAEIEEKNHDLERADRLKSEFLANMSHELRTPLNAILGFSELLLEQFYGPLNEEQSDYLRNIATSGEHLLALINDILDLSKIEAGRMELGLEAINVSSLLHNSLAIVREKAHQADVRLIVDEGDVEVIDADPRKLKQIIFNLLSNAVKFTRPGGAVTLAAHSADRPEVGAGVEISVADTGIGISAEDQQRLFQEFTQVDGSLSRRHEGTGLGLALTKRLVELHGGQISVRSATGEGSTFTVWLPLVPVAEAPPTASAPVAAASSGNGTLPTPAVVSESDDVEAPLILIVDDEDATATLIASYLEGAGYRTARACNGIEGLAQARALRPSGITLDVMMPEMDGWSFLEATATDDFLRTIPVIVVSLVNDVKHGWSLGASAVLAKPLRRDDLYGALAKLEIMPHNGSPARVLVVDDDPRAIKLVGGYLTSLGHEVIEAYGGERGIELAMQTTPDLIILDLMMPEVTGFMVVDRLRENFRTQNIPIIVLTAKIVTSDERKRLNGYVTTIAEKSSLNCATFLAEVNRAVRVGNDREALVSGR